MTAEEESVEVFVLMDGDRNYYLVPRDVLDGGRASDKQWFELEHVLDSDVYGYLLGGREPGRDSASTTPANARFAPVGALRLSQNALLGLIGRSQASCNTEGDEQ